MITLLYSNLDFIAAAFTIAGIVAIANKRRSGWIVASCGSVIWFVVSLIAAFSGRPLYGQTVLSVVTLGTNAYGYWKWGQSPP